MQPPPRIPGLRRAVVLLAALAFLVGAGPSVQAQTHGSLVGTVLDEQTGEPLEGATVVIQEARSGAITNADGTFSLDGVPEGSVTVRIAMEGYSTLVETLEVLPGEITLIRFQLLPLWAVLEGLVVTGDPSRGDAEGELRGELPGTATDLLVQRVPGLSVTRSDGEVGAGARISLRGVSSVSLSNDPAIYLDGVRIDEGGTAGAIRTLDQIPASSVLRIRVLRGPTAAMRYPLAASGVILVETRSGGGGG